MIVRFVIMMMMVVRIATPATTVIRTVVRTVIRAIPRVVKSVIRRIPRIVKSVIIRRSPAVSHIPTIIRTVSEAEARTVIPRVEIAETEIRTVEPVKAGGIRIVVIIIGDVGVALFVLRLGCFYIRILLIAIAFGSIRRIVIFYGRAFH